MASIPFTPDVLAVGISGIVFVASLIVDRSKKYSFMSYAKNADRDSRFVACSHHIIILHITYYIIMGLLLMYVGGVDNRHLLLVTTYN